PTSPRFDRLAETGVVFERAIATAPWSLPSHASMLTGRYNYELRTDFLRPLDDTYPTLAETLAGLGYVTIASLGNDFFGPAPYGLDRGFARYRVHPLTLGQVLRSSWLTGTLVPLVRSWLGNHQRLGRKRASAVNREILGWIDAARDRPFFAFVNYFDAHDPYLPPPPYDRRFIDPPYRYWLKSASEEYAEGELDELVAAYDNGIAYVDSQLGALVDALADRNALDRTLLIVTSDHGEAFLEHGEGAHGTSLHSEQLRVPLLLRFPGRVPAGVRVDLPVSIRDIPATVMALLGADERPRRFPGKPLSRFWNPSGRPRPEEEAVLAELRRDRSVVQGFWHYIRSADGSEELYDLSRDPFERVDLADTEGGRAEVERMRRVLERLLAAGAADRAG
ncbi:MAG: sulfatase, partial [Gemmatimonadota bacterium]